jgi:hypothetical protein
MEITIRQGDRFHISLDDSETKVIEVIYDEAGFRIIAFLPDSTSQIGEIYNEKIGPVAHPFEDKPERMQAITEDQAREIITAFGPATTLYETMSVNDIMCELGVGADIGQFLDNMIAVDDVTSDGLNDAAFHREEAIGPKGHHDAVIEQTTAFMNALKERVQVLRKKHDW